MSVIIEENISIASRILIAFVTLIFLYPVVPSSAKEESIKEQITKEVYLAWIFMDNARYEEAFDHFHFAAEHGDGNSQIVLGHMYEEGNGVEKSYSESLRWYRKAAKQGRAEAQIILSNMYRQGLGVGKDERIADMWLREATDEAIGTITIIDPPDGAVVKNPLTVCFKSKGLKLLPSSSINKVGEGHHHLLIDTHFPRELNYKSRYLPMKMIHLSDGQSCYTLPRPLTVGEHTIRGMFSNNNHIPYNPLITDLITVYVEE